MTIKYEEFREKVVAKAWKDPEFKKRLKENPKEALKECGFSFDEKTNINVLEDSSNTFTFVIPAQPKSSNDLSEQDLAKMAGGACSTIIWP